MNPAHTTSALGKVLQHRASAGIVLLILLIMHQLVSVKSSASIIAAFENSAHTPFFFVLTLLAFLFLKTAFKAQSLLVCLLILMVVLAGATELMQTFTDRSVSWGDFARNLLGISSALCLLEAMTSAFFRPSLNKRMLYAVSILLLLCGFWPVAQNLSVKLDKMLLAPGLLALDSGSLRGRVRIRAPYERLTAADAQNITGYEIDLSFSRYPGITLPEPFTDWSEYKSIVIRAQAVGVKDVPLVLRIQTAADKGFEQAQQLLVDGEIRQYTVALVDVLPDSEKSVEQVRNVFLYAEMPLQGKLRVFNIWLE